MHKVYGSKRAAFIIGFIFLGCFVLIKAYPKEIIPWLGLILFAFLTFLLVWKAFFSPIFTFDDIGIHFRHLVFGQERTYPWSDVNKIDDNFAGKKYPGYVVRCGKKADFVVQRSSYTKEDLDTLLNLIQIAKRGNPELAVSPSLLEKVGLPLNFATTEMPAAKTRNDSAKAVHQHPVVTYLLLVVLAVIFILELVLKIDFSGSAISLGQTSFLVFGAVSHDLVIGHGDWFRLFTAMFLHADPIHILGNSVALYFAGAFLEEYFGRAWFFALFVLGGLAGTISSILLNSPDTLSLGASGAIMGLLAADFILAFRLPAGATKSRAQSLSLRILIPSLLPQFSHGGTHVDISAHLGGAVVGTLIGLILLTAWRKGDAQPPFYNLAKGICLMAFGLFVLAGFSQARVYGMTRQVLEGVVLNDTDLSKVLDSETLDCLGSMFRKGERVSINNANAFRLYRLAAEKGYALAEFHLGYMYHAGLGIQKDDQKAIQWYQKAADQGDGSGQIILGFEYEHGLGVKKDYQKALKLYQLAADSGYPTAQNCLGNMYENGLGVKKDEAEAMKWYQKAANNGDAQAKKNLSRLSRKN